MQLKQSQAVPVFLKKLSVHVQVKTAAGDLAPQHAVQKTNAGVTNQFQQLHKAIQSDSLI